MSLKGRLIEEAQITSQLKHPNIVAVHELGVDQQGEIFFSMDFVEGRTLTEVIREVEPDRRTKKLLFEHLQIFIKVCDAVAYAHSLGIIHRDLKPGNIMVGNFGAVYVMDWGIARKKEKCKLFELDTMAGQQQQRYWTETEHSLGTWGYMAPEQIANEESEIGERTDVFQLGGVLYEILTHSPPYDAKSFTELKQKVRSADIIPPEKRVNPSLLRSLCQIATKALSRNPADRHVSVEKLKEDAWIGSFLSVLAKRFKEKDRKVLKLETENEQLKSKLEGL